MFMNHEGSVIVSDWAAGFMLGLGKSIDAWTKILLNRYAQETGAYLSYLMIWGTVSCQTSLTRKWLSSGPSRITTLPTPSSLFTKLVPHNAPRLDKNPIRSRKSRRARRPTAALEASWNKAPLTMRVASPVGRCAI